MQHDDNEAATYARWHDNHPDGVHLNTRRELAFAMRFPSICKAEMFGARMLRSNQMVRHTRYSRRVMVYAVMYPSEENVDGYREMLREDAARYGGVECAPPVSADPCMQPKDGGETGFCYGFPSHSQACQAALACQHLGGKVRLLRCEDDDGRGELCLSARLLPSKESVKTFQERVAPYIESYGGEFICLGYAKA